MVHTENNLTFSLTTQPHPSIEIIIPQQRVAAMYQKMLYDQQVTARTAGFTQGTVPIAYVECTFKHHIIEYLKEFFFYYSISNFLFKQRIDQKLILAGEPILKSITLDPHTDASFVFDIILVNPQAKNDWKKLLFKAPERKNYKDLDRQVESFIKEETEKSHKNVSTEVQIGDWVCIAFHIVNEQNVLLIPSEDHFMWVKVGDEESDEEIHALLLHKNVGDTFLTNNELLQNYISPHLDTTYTFSLTIIQIIPALFFSFDHFKRHFKIKNNKEMHLKLIEVFSCRNDITQRRETVESALKLLLNNYHIPLEEASIEKQKEQVLDLVHLNPDYHVYKAQPDFKNKIWQLAVKQLKEAIIIDYLAQQEQIMVTEDDVASYLNLIKKPRTKEFVYFDITPWKMGGKDRIIAHDVLRQLCLREKTLNHVLHHLTKK
ncbi:MAG: trigger factor [Candidatus Babeliaceae bacterium]|jgi:FKBP-type peptidyl-prolyl cis-trans isomerase (trigger factor)